MPFFPLEIRLLIYGFSQVHELTNTIAHLSISERKYLLKYKSCILAKRTLKICDSQVRRMTLQDRNIFNSMIFAFCLSTKIKIRIKVINLFLEGLFNHERNEYLKGMIDIFTNACAKNIKIELSIEFDQLMSSVRDVYEILKMFTLMSKGFKFHSNKFKIDFNYIEAEGPERPVGLYDFLTLSN